jgi:hypothetical protein
MIRRDELTCWPYGKPRRFCRKKAGQAAGSATWSNGDLHRSEGQSTWCVYHVPIGKQRGGESLARTTARSTTWRPLGGIHRRTGAKRNKNSKCAGKIISQRLWCISRHACMFSSLSPDRARLPSQSAGRWPVWRYCTTAMRTSSSPPPRPVSALGAKNRTRPTPPLAVPLIYPIWPPSPRRDPLFPVQRAGRAASFRRSGPPTNHRDRDICRKCSPSPRLRE